MWLKAHIYVSLYTFSFDEAFDNVKHDKLQQIFQSTTIVGNRTEVRLHKQK